MSPQGFVRARRPEQKQQRRETILAAARELALEHGVGRVTLGSVADAVGLAKSNVIRYYGTREEIFLALAAEGWQEWRDTVSERLDAGEGAVDVLAETLSDRPLFCDLLSLTATTLEHNISLEAARAFKQTVLATVGALAATVSRALPDLTEREAVDLVAAAAALAGSLYPVATPPPVLAELYTLDPELAAACPPLLPTLRRALSALTAGLPTLR